MSFFNNIEKLVYRKETVDPVLLLEYIKFSDEKRNEKYLVFKFKNNLTQQLKEMKVLVNLFDENNCLIGTTTFVYKNFIAKGLEEFVPKAKLLVNYATKYVEVKILYAHFDTLVWEEEKFTKLEKVAYTDDTKVEKKSKKAPKKVEKEKKPKGARKTKMKDISKKNRVVFPKVLAIILAVVLIGVTAFGVYYVSTYGRTLTSSDFEFEIVSSSKIAITKYIGDEEDVVIPATYKKYEVVSIEYKAFEYSIVETVEFESGKITIKGKAFYHCEELLSIVDENGAVRTAEKDAFYKCPSLEEVILPKAKVLTGAFVECDVLTSLSVNSVEGEELSECGAPASLTTFSIATGELSDIFFDGYSKITTLTLANDAYVSNSCFQDLPKLKKLYVGPNAIVSPSGLKQYSSLDLYLHVDYSEYSARDYKKQNSNINVYDYE